MEAIRVCVRVKPEGKSQIVARDNHIQWDKRSFRFDVVLTHLDDNQRVYNLVKKRIAAGSTTEPNCCVFAYGGTGSGKTYTMQALISRTLKDLPEPVVFSYCEVYSEKVYDLLFASDTPLKVRESSDLGVFVEGLKNVTLSRAAFKKRFSSASANRSVAATAKNSRSSRSHAILTFTVGQRKINLVDLAGSERVKESQVTGVALKEACAINKSLSTFNRVVTALSEQRLAPFRDSVLTRLLQSSLAGDSKTTLIATVDSSAVTGDTLAFANKVKQLKTKPKVKKAKKQRYAIPTGAITGSAVLEINLVVRTRLERLLT